MDDFALDTKVFFLKDTVSMTSGGVR
jgi:hypothetical protein